MALPREAGLTAAGLVGAGYMRFHDPFSAHLLQHSYLGSYQCRFADFVGVRYTLVVCHGARTEDARGSSLDDSDESDDGGEYFCPEAQFIRAGVRAGVEMLWRGHSLSEVEAFFAEVWSATGAGYAEDLDGAGLPSAALRH